MTDRSTLDTEFNRLLPLCDLKKSSGEKLFHADSFSGGTREWVDQCLQWLGLPSDLLPPERIYIHAGLKKPGWLLQSMDRSTGKKTMSLYIAQEIHISFEAVWEHLAHECAHLYLMHHGYQDIGNSEIKTMPPLYITHYVDESGRLVPTEPPVDPRELETEIAMFALGFGRLVLNGTTLYSVKKPGHRLGYLPLEDYAYLFKKSIDAMGIPIEEAAIGLCEEARDLLGKV